MCGRFAQVIKHDQLQKLARELAIRDSSEQIEANFNVSPTQTVAAFVSKDASSYIGFFRWGLIPSWMRELPKSALINARLETITEKPSFRGGMQKRRCVIPATGFYEWRQSDKQPFFIRNQSRDPLLLAGIYDAWYHADGSYIPSLAIITMDANSFMQPLHHRMPLLCDLDLARSWLDSSITNVQELIYSIGEMDLPRLEMYPVSTLVNSSRASGAGCMEPMVQTPD